jgi:hypothetical protein
VGENRNAYRIFVGKPEGKRPLRRLRYRWVDIIKIVLREKGWHSMDWIDLAQVPVEGPCEHGDEPSSSLKCWEALEWLHDWQVLKKGSAT